MKLFSIVLEWVLGRLFGGSDKTAIELGRTKNENEHLKKDIEDREALSKVNPAYIDDVIDSLRREDF